MSKAAKPKAKAVKKAEAIPPLDIPLHSAGLPVGAGRCGPEDFATWMRYEEWPLFHGAHLMLGLVPTQHIFSGEFVVLDYVSTAIPAELRQKFSNVYGLSKEALLPEATYRQSPRQYPRAYVTRDKYLAWAKAQTWLDVPAGLRAAPKHYWMRQDTKVELTRRETITRAQIVKEYQDRIDDGARVLKRIFDDHGNPRKAGDIDVVPLRVVYSDTGKKVLGHYVKELVRTLLEPLCNRTRVSAYAPGVSGRPQVWGPIKQPKGNRGKSSGNDED